MAKVWTKERIEVLEKYLNLQEFTLKEIAERMTSKKWKVTYDSVKNAVSRYNLKYQTPRKVQMNSVSQPSQVLKDMNDKEFIKDKKNAKLKWNIGKSKLSKNKKRPFKTYLVVGDAHIPLHNMPAIKSVLHLMDDVKFDGMINIGDFMDMGAISHWNQTKKKTLEGRRMKEDYIIGNAILDEFDKRLPRNAEKYYLWGNHEDWYNQLIEEYPMLEEYFSPTIELKLKERGYKVYPYNHVIRFGKLNITHGTYASQNPVKKHMLAHMGNIMFGHVHSPEMKCLHSDSREVSVIGYAVGCLCDVNPQYMRNRPNNWAHGFAVLYVYDNGYFDVDLKRIVKGKFVFNDKLYDGNS